MRKRRQCNPLELELLIVYLILEGLRHLCPRLAQSVLFFKGHPLQSWLNVQMLLLNICTE